MANQTKSELQQIVSEQTEHIDKLQVELGQTKTAYKSAQEASSANYNQWKNSERQAAEAAMLYTTEITRLKGIVTRLEISGHTILNHTAQLLHNMIDIPQLSNLDLVNVDTRDVFEPTS